VDEQRRLAREVDEALERIVRIARENARGTEETSAATCGQTASMHALASSAQELARTADQMKSLLATFRLRD
jgi:methyl-accepting chemotaxis protein